MRTVLFIRTALVGLLWATVVAALSFTTARYAEARNPTPTTVCCAAGTTGHSTGATP